MSVQIDASRIYQPIEPVRALLARISGLVQAMHADGLIGCAETDAMVASLEPDCSAALTDATRVVLGVGIVWGVGVESESESGMLWWRADSGEVAMKTHVLNPSSDSYYDYRKSEWFRAACAEEGLAIVGPFIDAWGTDDHTITASLAIRDGDTVIGVAAADLNVSVVTTELARTLRTLGDYVLVDREERVVASNLPALSPGLRLAPYVQRTGARLGERVATSVAGWQLVRVLRHAPVDSPPTR